MQPTLPELNPGRTMLNRLWPLLLSTIGRRRARIHAAAGPGRRGRLRDHLGARLAAPGIGGDGDRGARRRALLRRAHFAAEADQAGPNAGLPLEPVRAQRGIGALAPGHGPGPRARSRDRGPTSSSSRVDSTSGWRAAAGELVGGARRAPAPRSSSVEHGPATAGADVRAHRPGRRRARPGALRRRRLLRGDPARDRLLLDHRGAAVAATRRDLARLDRRREPARAPRGLAAGRRAPASARRAAAARHERAGAGAAPRAARGCGGRAGAGRALGPARADAERDIAARSRTPATRTRSASSSSSTPGRGRGATDETLVVAGHRRVDPVGRRRARGPAGARGIPGAAAARPGVRRRPAPRGLRDRAARGARRRLPARDDARAGAISRARSRSRARPAAGRATTSCGALRTALDDPLPGYAARAASCSIRSAARPSTAPSPSACCHDWCQDR